MNLPNSTLDLENDILNTLTLSYNRLLNASSWLGANIAQLASYTSGSGTITLPSNFTHILIIMGWGGGGGGGSDGTAYGSGGGGAWAFILWMRSKSELTWTSLSYSIGSWGSGWTAWNPWSNGWNTTLSGSNISLTAWGGYGGHRWTSARGGNTWYGGTATTQLTKDLWITGADGGNYNSGAGYPVQTSFTFFGIGKGGINGPDQGAGSYDGVGGTASYSNNNYLSSLDGSCSGGGGVGGYHSLTGGNGAKGFLRIYYFYN